MVEGIKEISMLVFNFGDRYYSVGPLQGDGIEKWTFSMDRYDASRAEIGNMFKTREEALAFKEVLITINNYKDSVDG